MARLNTSYAVSTEPVLRGRPLLLCTQLAPPLVLLNTPLCNVGGVEDADPSALETKSLVPTYKVCGVAESMTIGTTSRLSEVVGLLIGCGIPMSRFVQLSPPLVLIITRNCETPVTIRPLDVAYNVCSGPLVQGLGGEGGDAHERGSSTRLRTVPTEAAGGLPTVGRPVSITLQVLPPSTLR